MARSRTLAFILLLLFALAFWWNALADTFHLAWSNEAYSHIILILPLSLALIYLDSKTVRPAIEPAWLGGPFLLLVALALGCAARWGGELAPGALRPDLRLTLSLFAFVLWSIASVLLCFGLATVRAFLFPLCFLFWLVPLPDAVVNRIIAFLQMGSALATRWLFELTRVPVSQNGVFLSFPGGFTVEVAPECSSIRSSMVLMVITMILAHLFLRSWQRKVLVVLLAIPLAVAKNALRIFVIVGLALRVNRDYFNGDLHHRGGVVFLMAALAMVGALLWLLARTEPVGSS